MKIVYDPDLPAPLRPQVKEVIEESDLEPCSECGCDEIYVSYPSENTIDVKCYDCGTSYFELEIELDEETTEREAAE